MPKNETIDITLCIGMFGVCVISIVGDDYDIVSNQLDLLGAESWHEELPKHEKPIEGIYTMSVEVTDHLDEVEYNIVKSEAA